MKLGDGRKVAIHEASECEERTKLYNDYGIAFEEWLKIKGEVEITPKNHPSYGEKVRDLKSSNGRLKARTQDLDSHTRTHGCW